MRFTQQKGLRLCCLVPASALDALRKGLHLVAAGITACKCTTSPSSVSGVEATSSEKTLGAVAYLQRHPTSGRGVFEDQLLGLGERPITASCHEGLSIQELFH